MGEAKKVEILVRGEPGMGASMETREQGAKDSAQSSKRCATEYPSQLGLLRSGAHRSSCVQRQNHGDQLPSSTAGQRDSLAQLADAVSVDTGVPPGRVLRILQCAELLRSSMDKGYASPPTPSVPTKTPTSTDRLRWYPFGPNGRIQPPVPPGLEL